MGLGKMSLETALRAIFEINQTYVPLTAGYVPNEALLGSKVKLRPTLLSFCVRALTAR